MKSLALVACVAGCTERNAATCLETHCPDPERPFCDVDGTISGEPNSCVAVECAPGGFEACRGDQALVCNSAGNSYDLVECEFGCSDAAGGCEPCNTSMCEPHIIPKYLLTACNQLAEGNFEISSDLTVDTSNNLNCTSVVAQTGGPEICVIQQKTITVPRNMTLKFIGPRAVALVAVRDVLIDGVLDVSADAGLNGPGGGFVNSGTTPEYDSNAGGGGAGGATAGGSGADETSVGGANNGGAPATHPSMITQLVGGASPSEATVLSSLSNPGGGGGAVTVVSCRGDVLVPGVIDAGGGGGHGENAVGAKRYHATGGGSGGTVVLQGMGVNITGTVVANGGGGGSSGSTLPPGFNPPGEDGTRTTSRASGGASMAGDGGFGGAVLPPTSGAVFRGAGGGSAGFILVYTPIDVNAVLAADIVSPKFDIGFVPTN